jgi:glycosyltransferase involved in cell wall biosynthesis
LPAPGKHGILGGIMQATKKHSVSAVLVNHNHGTFLPNAIKGILEQSVPFDEIILIDDASTDNSLSVMESHIQNVPHARVLRNSGNCGVVATLNKAMHEVTGDFVALLAADDRYNPQLVEICHGFLSRYPDVAMISGNARTVHADTWIEQAFTLPFPQEFGAYGAEDVKQVAQTRAFTFFGGANVFSRQALLEVGGQREELKWHADWFLYLQLAYRYRFGVVPVELVSQRRTEADYSKASHDWRVQRPVLETFVRLLQQEYPGEYIFFRECGLLPTYDMEALPMLLAQEDLRDFLTPLLAWRLLTYKPLRLAGQMVPNHLKEEMRRMARV